MYPRQAAAVCVLFLLVLAGVIIAMPATDRTDPDLEATHTRQHDADETQEDALDAGHGEYDDEAYEDEDIYDDEEYLHLLLGLNVSVEDIGRQKTHTLPSSEVSPEAVTSSSADAESPVVVDDQGAQYEDNLQPRKRSSGTVGVANILSVTTKQPGQPRDIAAGVSRGNSVGPTPSTGSAEAAEIGGLSAGVTTTGASVTGGVGQLASLLTDCQPAHNDGTVNYEEGPSSRPLMGQGAAGAGQLLPCGRNVHLVARQPVHRGPSAEVSGTGGTTGQQASASSDTRDLGLGLDGPVVIDGLKGRGQGHAGDATNRLHNADLHRGNNYNIGNVDSNMDSPSGGANRSRSPETNIHLVVTPDEQVHAVRPVHEDHQDETGQPSSTGQLSSTGQPSSTDQPWSTGQPRSTDKPWSTSQPSRTDQIQPGYNATAGGNQTRNISSNLLSSDTTNTSKSITHAPLGASLSDAISASQLDISSVSNDITSQPDVSVSHDITPPGLLVIPTQRQAGSHIDCTHDSTFTNGLSPSISTLTASRTFSSAAPEFQMTELWPGLTQLPTSQPKSNEPWYFHNNGHNRNQADVSAMDILPTMTILHERVPETSKYVWDSDDSHDKIERGHTFKITSSTATSLTPSIEDVGHSIFTYYSPTNTSGIGIVLATSSYSTPSPELEISATPVVEIMSTTITILTHGPALEDSTTKADNPPERRTSPTTPELAEASTWPTNESTWQSSQQQPVSASSLTSPHPPTVGGDSTENQVSHTKPRQSSADMDRVTSETAVKPGATPTLPENTTSITEPAAEMPSLLMELKFRMSWPDFCQNEASIRGELAELVQGAAERVDITPDQLQLLSTERELCHKVPSVGSPEISVHMYVLNKSRRVDDRLTTLCTTTLQTQLSATASSGARSKLISVHIYGDTGLGPSTDTSMTPDHSEEEEGEAVGTLTDPGVTIAVILASVGGCYCLGVVVLQITIRCRGKDTAIPRFKHSFSVTSSDSMQLTSVVKSRPNSGLFNPALDLTDQMEKLEPSNPLNFIQLSKMCMNESKIHEEYQKIPHQMARLSVVPAGDEDKNRYANVLPLAHTRVRLLQNELEPRSSYINANYVTGPNQASHYYIATQGPTERTTADFWTMVWQQGCHVIVMLTQLEEEGQVRCASYWPEHALPSAAQRHGHFLIQLQQKDVRQEYIHSRLQINNLREIESREVDHFWYTCWPSVGVPDPVSLVKLVLDTRPRYQAGGTPLVVHCSPGTGRTCTFIALDLCMRQFEERRVVDVMKTVHSIRQERAGAVQNKEQYTLLYNAVSEYAMMVVSPAISAASSATTLHALLQS